MSDQTDKKDDASFERYPLTRAEYISAMVHLYRGEQHRAQVWRTRLDTTTNWAVISMGALLSFAFTNQEKSGDIVLVLGMYMIFTMLVFESRRFRFYDVWRHRVRRVEENFYVPILRRDLTSPVENWGFFVAEDLLNPSYKISFLMAMKARLVNNYLPLFGVLFAAWGFRFFRPVNASDAIIAEAVPDWIQVVGVAALYLFIAYVMIFVRRAAKAEDIYFGSRSVDSIDDVG
ncbi:MAG: putative membrane protein [Planctomycetota bacterium]